MHALISAPPDSSSPLLVRLAACVTGTPPNTSDPYSFAVSLSSGESLPSEAAAPYCPSRHDCVLFLFSSDRHACDGCTSPIPRGSHGWRCFLCNYDLCSCCRATYCGDVDSRSVLSRQILNGVCDDWQRHIALYACASAHDISRLEGQGPAARSSALVAHATYGGRDAEGWAGHYGVAFACASLSYLNQVTSSAETVIARF